MLNHAKNLMKRFFQEEEAQGATEYILLLVVIVAIAMMFRNQITEAVRGKLGDLSGDLQGFTGQQ